MGLVVNNELRLPVTDAWLGTALISIFHFPSCNLQSSSVSCGRRRQHLAVLRCLYQRLSGSDSTAESLQSLAGRSTSPSATTLIAGGTKKKKEQHIWAQRGFLATSGHLIFLPVPSFQFFLTLSLLSVVLSAPKAQSPALLQRID